ncbi:P2X purinoceptor 5 isoform X4 [Zalophus californianus]|uniref:P2X purinoceptor n=1 Tax=Zalophus californianus TaxID=9704 RepID=A0A6P9F5C8_ZALCA|nr:P2X purinoceptor 5 isoform X4 [Zalophus californianus]
MGQAGCKGLSQSLFDYKTEKYVIAKNKKVGLLYRLLQVSILTYLVVWVFLVKKGYQDTDTSLQSSIVTKVKGVTFTNTSELGERLWDVADYVIPPQGENVFFVVTNLIVTANQRQETCAESESIPDAWCYTDSDCPPGEPVVAGNGVKTGRCLRVGSMQRGTCEVFAWCPVETKPRPVKPLLGKAEDFTVYIKNFIRFPKFNFSKTNVLDTNDRAFLKSCRFGPKNPYCPIFRLGSVVSWTGSNFQEIAVQPSGQQIFRKLNLLWVQLQAGKFSLIPTVVNIGSGVALMGAGAFVCDLVLIYFIKKRHFYRDKKYEEVRILRVLQGLAEPSQQGGTPEAEEAGQPEAHLRGGTRKGKGCAGQQHLQTPRATWLQGRMSRTQESPPTLDCVERGRFSLVFLPRPQMTTRPPACCALPAVPPFPQAYSAAASLSSLSGHLGKGEVNVEQLQNLQTVDA